MKFISYKIYTFGVSIGYGLLDYDFNAGHIYALPTLLHHEAIRSGCEGTGKV